MAKKGLFLFALGAAAATGVMYLQKEGYIDLHGYAEKALDGVSRFLGMNGCACPGDKSVGDVGEPDITLVDTNGDGTLDTDLPDTDGDGKADTILKDADGDVAPDLVITESDTLD